jgi:hypothetical protein
VIPNPITALSKRHANRKRTKKTKRINKDEDPIHSPATKREEKAREDSIINNATKTKTMIEKRVERVIKIGTKKGPSKIGK